MDLARSLKGVLMTSLDPQAVDSTFERWIGLLSSKKFHYPIAKNTLKLKRSYVKDLNYSDVQSILSETHFSIESAKIYRGQEITVANIVLMFADLFKYVKVGKAIEDEALKDLAEMLLEDYPYLSFPDLKLCLKNGIKGKYGEIYDRLDVPVIFSWFRQYDEERTRISQKLKQEAHKQRMQEEKGVPMPEAIRKKFEELEHKVKAQDSEKKEFKPTLSKQIEHLR